MSEILPPMIIYKIKAVLVYSAWINGTAFGSVTYKPASHQGQKIDKTITNQKTGTVVETHCRRNSSRSGGRFLIFIQEKIVQFESITLLLHSNSLCWLDLLCLCCTLAQEYTVINFLRSSFSSSNFAKTTVVREVRHNLHCNSDDTKRVSQIDKNAYVPTDRMFQ